MRGLLALFAALIVALGASGCAVTKYSTDPHAPKGSRSATVTIESNQAAHWASSQTGQGKLMYEGRTYPFEITAVGIGGNGIQEVKFIGDVYNLKRLSDFPGKYNGLRSGVTLGEGKINERLKAENGVVIYLSGSTKGVANSNGADHFVIKMLQ